MNGLEQFEEDYIKVFETFVTTREPELLNVKLP
jgi:hypothetical protein